MQEQQIGHENLERLLSAAENYFLILYKGDFYYRPKYLSYEQKPTCKGTYELRNEFVKQIKIYQDYDKYFRSKYNKGLEYQDQKLFINDIYAWKTKMENPKDKALYDGILSILNNIPINTDILSNEDEKSSQKIGRQNIEYLMLENPLIEKKVYQNYEPKFQRKKGNNNYSKKYFNEVDEDEMPEFFDEAKRIVFDLDHLLMIYHQGNNVIEDIKKKYYNLEDLVKRAKDNSSYIFLEKITDIINEKNLLRSLHSLMSKERNIDNMKLFGKLEELLKLIENLNYR